MNGRLCVASLLLTASCSAVAQLTVLPERQIQTAVGVRDQIENRSRATILAFHTTFRCPKTASHSKANMEFMFDSLVNFGPYKPISPGDAFSYPMQPWAVGCPGGVDAVIFGDGSSLGDSKQVAFMQDNERGVFEGLTFAEPLVATVGSGGADPNQVAVQLHSQIEKWRSDSSRSTAEGLGAMFSLGVTAHLLETQTNLHVPSDSTTNQKPTVETLAAAQKIPMQQAHAQVLGLKLNEWSSALKEHVQAPKGSF
jgi:hypothetical protein